MTRTPIRAVVFDLDGTMFDTEALSQRVLSSMLADRGKVMTPAMMSAMIGRQAPGSYLSLIELAGLTEGPDELLADFRSRFYALLDDAVHPTAGLYAILDAIGKRKLPAAVATSSRRSYAEALLTSHGLLDRFAFTLCAEDVTHGKPDPEIYLTAAARLGLADEPGAMMVLEDSAPGVAAAVGAGAFAVAIPHDHSPASGLTAADLIVPRLDDAEVLRLLDPGTGPG